MYDLSLIKGYLDTKYIGQTIIQFDELKSTNAKAKSIFDTCPDGTVILSENQLKCRVRFGREWNSYPDKNIYLSIILKLDEKSFIISQIETISTASVCKSICHLFHNLQCKTKWPNDIIINDKKVSSISCELIKSKNNIEGLIVYIGINVNIDENEIDENLKNIATSIKIEADSQVDREMLIGCVLNCFEILYDEFINNGNIEKSKNICMERSVLIGRDIKINKFGKKNIRKVYALNIDDNGNLVVTNEKKNEEIINSGEVTVVYE